MKSLFFKSSGDPNGFNRAWRFLAMGCFGAGFGLMATGAYGWGLFAAFLGVTLFVLRLWLVLREKDLEKKKLLDAKPLPPVPPPPSSSPFKDEFRNFPFFNRTGQRSENARGKYELAPGELGEQLTELVLTITRDLADGKEMSLSSLGLENTNRIQILSEGFLANIFIVTTAFQSRHPDPLIEETVIDILFDESFRRLESDFKFEGTQSAAARGLIGERGKEYDNLMKMYNPNWLKPLSEAMLKHLKGVAQVGEKEAASFSQVVAATFAVVPRFLERIEVNKK